MSDVYLPCEKGCGGLLPVDESAYRNSILLEQPIHVQHDTCPTDGDEPTPPAEPVPLRRFWVQVIVAEVDTDTAELLAEEEVTDPTVEVECLYGGFVLTQIAGAGVTLEGATAGEVIP